ncbi:MAG TPA: hypothetical protein VFU81_12975 [Thermomicrobiales bacterium]|nr:hypothetical protein [Thermomicrobiales bacterium]
MDNLGDQIRGSLGLEQSSGSGGSSHGGSINTGGHQGGSVTLSGGGGGTVSGPVSSTTNVGQIGGTEGVAIADASGGNHNVSFVS